MMNPEHFDSELKTYYLKIKAEIKNEHSDYVKKHPELRKILNDFMSSILLEKPQDVYEYATEYFSYYNIDKDKIRHPPLVICGPSGVGKGTIIQKMIDNHPDKFEKNISYTTRHPRQGETQGVQYFFVSKGEFEKEIAKDSFFQYIQHNSQFFGTHKGKLNAIINTGKICFLELDIDSAKKVYDEHPQWKYIFLQPSKTSILEERMKEKGVYTEAQIKKRMETGIVQIEKCKKYDIFTEFKNDSLDKTYDDILKFIKQQYSNFKI